MSAVLLGRRLPVAAFLVSSSLAFWCVAVLSSQPRELRLEFKWLALVMGLVALSFAGMLVVRQGLVALPRIVLSSYIGLVALGVWSYAMLVDYKAAGYPIALYQPLPTADEVAATVARDVVGLAALLYGVLVVRRRRGTDLTHKLHSGHGQLLPLARVLLVLGAACALVLVGATGRVAFFSDDVDAVRYSQGAGLGFVTLLQYVLIPSIVLAVAAGLCDAALRRQAVAVAGLAVLILLLTRAERTPLLLGILGCALFAAQIGRRLSFRTAILLGAGAVAFIFVLGLFRFESQSTQVSADERRVRTVFDISPEARERAYAYRFYGTPDLPFLGPQGALPLALSVVPGRVLGLAGIDKQDVYTDSSRQYSLAMRQIGLYTQEKPLRVGLQGELWMYGGWLSLLVGMFLYGLLVATLARPRSTDAVATATSAVAGAYALIGLILPLAALAPIVLASMAPLFLRRSS